MVSHRSFPKFGAQVGGDNNLLLKEHTHTFINEGGNVGGKKIYKPP
jgi:hypothetical protein